MDQRAILNGAISGGIAIVLVQVVILVFERILPELRTIRDWQSLTMLYGGLVLLGIGITLFSTHRSVIKYLKMKLDDLY